MKHKGTNDQEALLSRAKKNITNRSKEISKIVRDNKKVLRDGFIGASIGTVVGLGGVAIYKSLIGEE